MCVLEKTVLNSNVSGEDFHGSLMRFSDISCPWLLCPWVEIQWHQLSMIITYMRWDSVTSTVQDYYVHEMRFSDTNCPRLLCPMLIFNQPSFDPLWSAWGRWRWNSAELFPLTTTQRHLSPASWRKPHRLPSNEHFLSVRPDIPG